MRKTYLRKPRRRKSQAVPALAFCLLLCVLSAVFAHLAGGEAKTEDGAGTFSGHVVSSFEFVHGNALRLYLVRTKGVKSPSYVGVLSALSPDGINDPDFLGPERLCIFLDLMDMKSIALLLRRVDEESLPFEIKKTSFGVTRRLLFEAGRGNGSCEITLSDDLNGLKRRVSLSMSHVESISFSDMLLMYVDLADFDRKSRIERSEP